ncbi:MAG TPA: bifunctional hydroxymethylpyrimidine kinase/phosphomethylpyrimidine kinase [Nitrospiria bacterium]|nr:bifunctional hydroxymethylpyrimidine kinase/phosphomethylpyrimidine kinase [Nitrospiria bacterium]
MMGMPKIRTLPQALTIATSDSGGGAGIQGDIKAMAANGVFGLSVVVAITAQNTTTVSRIHAVPSDVITAQLDAVFGDFAITAVKTGMLHSAEIVRTVADYLRTRGPIRLVVDPVMVSSTGVRLLEPAAVKAMINDLLPLAEVVTPNVPEAEALTGMRIATIDDARAAAQKIRQYGCRAVLIKGGHLSQAPATDVLFDGASWTEIPGEWIDSPHTHGTGCAYSAAIAAHLATGADLVSAVRAAKTYITGAIRRGLAIGHGKGPMNLLYRLEEA